MHANYPLTHPKALSPALILVAAITTIVINYILIAGFMQAYPLTSPLQAAEQKLPGRIRDPRLPAVQPLPVPTPPPAANTATPTPAQLLTGQSQPSLLALQPAPVPTPPVH